MHLYHSFCWFFLRVWLLINNVASIISWHVYSRYAMIDSRVARKPASHYNHTSHRFVRRWTAQNIDDIPISTGSLKPLLDWIFPTCLHNIPATINHTDIPWTHWQNLLTIHSRIKAGLLQPRIQRNRWMLFIGWIIVIGKSVVVDITAENQHPLPDWW